MSKTWYKIIKILVKYIPYLIGFSYFVSVVLSCFSVEVFSLFEIFCCGLVPTLCLISFSFLLNFCVWHRLPLYYALLINMINAIDFYWTIPIGTGTFLMIYCLITGLFVLLGAYLKNKYNVKNKNR